MRKNIFVALFIYFVNVNFLYSTVAVYKAEEDVQIETLPNNRVAARVSRGTQVDLRFFDDLYRANPDITDFDFSGNQKIKDIKGIAAFSEKVKSINFKGSNVTDIEPLRNFNNLQTVDIRDTPVRDLTPLASLVRRNLVVQYKYAFEQNIFVFLNMCRACSGGVAASASRSVPMITFEDEDVRSAGKGADNVAKAYKGDIDAMFLLAEMYYHGTEEREPNIDLAEHWYEKVAKNHFLPAIFRLAQIMETHLHSPKRALSLYRQAAQKGFIEAQIHLGDYYKSIFIRGLTHRVRPDLEPESVSMLRRRSSKKQALQWFDKVIQSSGLEYAIQEYQFINKPNRIIEERIRVAEESRVSSLPASTLVDESTESDDHKALLAYRYFLGKGVRKNTYTCRTMAEEILRSNQDCGMAHFLKGLLYYHAEGGYYERYKEAFQYFKKSHALGCSHGTYYLALTYIYHPSDTDKRCNMYSTECGLYYKDGEFSKSLCQCSMYDDKYPIKNIMESARALLLISVGKNNPLALRFLAKCHLGKDPGHWLLNKEERSRSEARRLNKLAKQHDIK